MYDLHELRKITSVIKIPFESLFLLTFIEGNTFYYLKVPFS